MKNFTSYLTEISGGQQSAYDDFDELNDRLHEKLVEYYQKENPLLSPNNPLKTPHHSIRLGKNEDTQRLYSWNSWMKGMASLAHSISAHHFAQGSLTGRVGEQYIYQDPSKIKQIHEHIIAKHKPVIDSFQNQHKKFLSQLSSPKGDPEIGRIVDRLMTHYGASLDDINDSHFNYALNRHLVAGQMPYIEKHKELLDEITHDRDQATQRSLHNAQVFRHEHPLGYFLNGGPNIPESKSQLGQVAPTSIKEIKHPTGDWVDITHKFV